MEYSGFAYTGNVLELARVVLLNEARFKQVQCSKVYYKRGQHFRLQGQQGCSIVAAKPEVFSQAGRLKTVLNQSGISPWASVILVGLALVWPEVVTGDGVCFKTTHGPLSVVSSFVLHGEVFK